MDSSPLAKLPGELRQQIWDQALFPDEGVCIDLSGETSQMHRGLAITQVCRQIRAECRDSHTFFTKNNFRILTRRITEDMDVVCDLRGEGPLEPSTIREYTQPKRSFWIARTMDRLERLLLAIPGGTQRREQCLQLHLGTWNTLGMFSTYPPHPHSTNLLSELATMIDIFTTVLHVLPQVEIDLVCIKDSSRYEFGRLTLSPREKEQSAKVLREAVRQQRRAIGWNSTHHDALARCSKAGETFFKILTEARHLPAPKSRVSLLEKERMARSEAAQSQRSFLVKGSRPAK